MKRQANALTAVLENWQDVENAIDIYANSAGSALRENEIYLDSWEAKSKAVSAAWNELVNSLLDSNWIKGFLDGAQNVLSWLTNTNALIPVLAGLIGGVLTLAIQGLVKWIQGLKVALTEVNLLAGGIPLLIGLITTLAVGVVTWGINASDTAKQIENLTNQIEEQQKAIDDLNAKEKEATDLYKEYASLMSKSNAYGLSLEEKESLLKISSDLVDTYGLEVQGIDAVTGAYIIGANAINDYVEALRQERIEKQKDQTDTRNKRIEKNIGSVKSNKSSNIKGFVDDIQEKYETVGTIKKADAHEFVDNLLKENEIYLIDEYYDEFLKLGKEYLSTGNEDALKDILSEITIKERERQQKIASIAKDILTNIQIDNADILDSNSESLLTQILTPYLTTVDWETFDKKDFEDKVSSFISQHKGIIDNLINDTSETSKNITSSNVSVNDYKKYIENETTKANILASIIGGEEGKKEAQKIINGLSNSFGAMMAEISNGLGENSGVFDKFTTEFLRLEQQFISGEITFKEYTDGINKSLNSLDIEKTFGDNEESVKSFFSTMQTKGENVVKNIATEFQAGKTSLEDYMGQVEQISGYFISLGNKAASALGENSPISQSIKESSNNLSELLKELKLVQSAVKESSVSFEDFKKKPINSIESLVNKLLDLGITIQDLGGDATDSAKDIAKSLQSDTEAFAKMQTALATKTQSVLAQIGGSIGKILSGVKEYIKGFKVRFNVDLNYFDDGKIGLVPEVSGDVPADSVDKVNYALRVSGGNTDLKYEDFTPEQQKKYREALKASDDEVYFGNLLSNSIDSSSLSEFISGLDGGDVSTYTPTDKGNDSDKPDHEDSTDAIINRINLRSKELEQQEEEIQNAIEIAELEKDYKKQISLTNDLINTRKKRVDELNKANAGLHNEAERLRNSNAFYFKDGTESDENLWFDSLGNATEYYNKLINKDGITKEEREAIENLFENLSKYKKAYAENAEEIVGLNKEILQTENDIVDLRFENSQNWIEERNKNNDWRLFDDSEVDAWKRVIKWLKEDYPDAIDKIKEAEENLFEARKDQFDKSTDLGSSYYDSKKTLLQSYFDVTNSIAEAQHEINKELEASKTMYEYLDEDTRKLLFNQEDWNVLSEELYDIQYRADKLQRQYQYDLENATLDTIEEITSNYEMQYETLMKSYEIAKADLEIAKKKQKLDNVLNEKNVRMRINGEWQYVANTQDVIDAKAELADAEYAKRVEESGLTQQKSINDLTKKQNQLGTIISQFSNGVISLDSAIGTIVSRFRDLPDNILNGLRGASSYSSGTYYYSGRTLQVNKDGTAPSNAKRGDVIKTAGGDYLITGGASGNYSSIKIKESHADGTRHTPGGMTLLGEEGFEAFIDNNGHLIPINQPTIGNIGTGGIVFNQDQMTNLRSLWDLSNIGTMPSHNISNITNRQMSETINYQLFGDMIFDGNNPEEIFRKMADFFKNTRYKSN